MELETAPSVFQEERMIFICNVDDLLIFTESEHDIQALKNRLRRDWVIKNQDKQTQFLQIAIRWLEEGTITLRQLNLITKLLSNSNESFSSFSMREGSKH